MFGGRRGTPTGQVIQHSSANWALALVLASCLHFGQAQRLSAQNPEVVFGRVTDLGRRSVGGVLLTVTGLKSGIVRSASTDTAGQFRVVFEEGERDYRLVARKIGYSLALRRVTRTGPSHLLMANIVLATNPFALEPITVTAVQSGTGQQNERVSIGGATESARDARRFLGESSDLTSLIGLSPGVQPGVGGLSALGAAPDQNSTLLDGMPFLGELLPPDALCGLDILDIFFFGFTRASRRCSGVCEQLSRRDLVPWCPAGICWVTGIGLGVARVVHPAGPPRRHFRLPHRSDTERGIPVSSLLCIVRPHFGHPIARRSA